MASGVSQRRANERKLKGEEVGGTEIEKYDRISNGRYIYEINP